MRTTVILGLLATALSAGAATAQPDVLVFDSDRLNGGGDAVANYELHTMLPNGTAVAQLTNNNAYDSWWGRPSPDGSRLVFCRTPAGVHDTDYSQVSLWRMNSDGTGLVQLRAIGADAWTIQGHPEWSPDGQYICTIGTAASVNGTVLQIFVVDADGLNPRHVAPTAIHQLDCSWSPDGANLLLVSKPTFAGAASTQEVYRVPAAGGALTRLTNDSIEDYDPYYSPSGARIAWLSKTDPAYAGGLGSWNIRAMNANGTGVVSVTNDVNINSKPTWSPDGTTVYFHRFVYGAPSPKWDIYRTPSSGGGALTQVSPGAPDNNTFPAYLHHAPVVTMTAPTAGPVSGTVTITVDAVSAAAISSVHFLVDGVDVATDTVAPFSYSWNADAAGPGSHTLQTIAIDAVGSSTTSAPVTVTVVAPGGGGGGSGGGGSGGGGCGVGGGINALMLLALYALGLRRARQQ